MILNSQEIKRVFILKLNNQEISLDDPNPNFSIEEVKRTYINAYPQLLNSKMDYKGFQPDVNATVYEFSTVAGTKA